MRREASSAARSDCTCPCAPRATTARPSFESEAVPASSGAEASNGRSSGAFVGVLRSERTIGQAATTTNTAEAARATRWAAPEATNSIARGRAVPAAMIASDMPLWKTPASEWGQGSTGWVISRGPRCGAHPSLTGQRPQISSWPR